MHPPLNILCVADDAATVSLLEDALRQQGWAAVGRRVDDPASLLSALAHDHWDLVFCCQDTARLPLAEIPQHCHAYLRDLPFMVVSCSLEMTDAVDLVKAGFADVVPIQQLDRLTKALERAWRDCEARRTAVGNDAQHLLARLHQQNDLILHCAAEGILGLDAEGRFSFVNPAAARMLGYKVEELLGREAHQTWHHTRADGTPCTHADCPIHNTLKRGILYRSSVEVFWRKDGTSFPVDYVSTPIQEQDRVVGVVVTFNDISDRKRIEEELRQSERLLQTVMDLVPHSIFAKDQHGRYLFVNRACAMANGMTQAQMVGLTDLDFAPSRAEAEAFMRDDQTVLASGAAKFIDEEPSTNAAGEHRLLQTTKIPFSMPGVGPALIGVAIDVTDVKKTEAKLRQSEAEFRAMFEVASIGMAQADPQTGRLLRVNERMHRITGFSQEELLRMTVSQLTYVEDRDKDWDLFQSVIRGEKQEFRVEKRYVRKDGAIVWVNVNMAVIRDALGQPLRTVATIEDITERRKLEAQLRQVQKLEGIGQLAGGVAHDFNNILASFMVQLSLLRLSPSLDAETRHAITDLETEAQRAANLTRQLLMFSRRSVLSVQPLDLNEILGSLLKMLRRLIGEHMDLVFEGGAALPLIEADAGMVEQVVMNLVVNARDAMPKGGRITISSALVHFETADLAADPNRKPGDFVCLKVADTGCGMDAATLKRVFEPFFTTKETGKGTGLGLATVHGIVAQHQGWVEVESQVGQGTRFLVYWPASDRAARPKERPASNAELPRGHETILLVEDEQKVRRLVALTMRTLGYQVHEAVNGREALTLWEAHRGRVDLLLTDMIMPEGLTGLDLVEKFRLQQPSLPAIVCSGYSHEIAQVGVLQKAGVVYLPKPFETQTLALTVRAALDRARKERA